MSILSPSVLDIYGDIATGRVRAGFLLTWTWPVGLDPRPEPDPIINWVFFPEPKPTPPGPMGPVYPATQIVAQQKKNFEWSPNSFLSPISI